MTIEEYLVNALLWKRRRRVYRLLGALLQSRAYRP